MCFSGRIAFTAFRPQHLRPGFARGKRAFFVQVPGIDHLRVAVPPSRYASRPYPEVHSHHRVGLHEPAGPAHGSGEIRIFHPAIQYQPLIEARVTDRAQTKGHVASIQIFLLREHRRAQGGVRLDEPIRLLPRNLLHSRPITKHRPRYADDAGIGLEHAHAMLDPAGRRREIVVEENDDVAGGADLVQCPVSLAARASRAEKVFDVQGRHDVAFDIGTSRCRDDDDRWPHRLPLEQLQQVGGGPRATLGGDDDACTHGMARDVG
jgi:hypothetical protein